MNIQKTIRPVPGSKTMTGKQLSALYREGEELPAGGRLVSIYSPYSPHKGGVTVYLEARRSNETNDVGITYGYGVCGIEDAEVIEVTTDPWTMDARYVSV